MRGTNKFVIFDRDGTLIEHIHYLDNPNLLELRDELIPALKILKQSAFKFGIISNQSIIGRGISTVEKVESVNLRLAQILSKENIFFDFAYICPHAPIEKCRCRKPKTKLAIDAILKYEIDINRSFMVGDSASDIQFGINVGLKSVYLGLNDDSIPANFSTTSLLSAAKWIINQ